MPIFQHLSPFCWYNTNVHGYRRAQVQGKKLINFGDVLCCAWLVVYCRTPEQERYR